MQKASAPWTPKTILVTLFCDATMITGVDIAVWTVSAVLAVGIGWSRYEKWKTRDRLVRELAAMEPARREKLLQRLNPKLAIEMREQLMERFQIMS
ncbi:MAG: hypothetical protein DMF04_07835 [Verrucomicrobia bacterium]|nr:MAG: hypothetical protein DMF04_07835 [Verrucomicrobiota bacterium]